MGHHGLGTPGVREAHSSKAGTGTELAPFPFSLLLQPPSPAFAPLFNGQFKFSPKSEVSRGLGKRKKKNIFVGDFFSLLVLGSLPPWPPSLLMNKRKVRTYQISFAAPSSSSSSSAHCSEHFCTTYPADHSPPRSPSSLLNPVTLVASPQAPKPERHLLPSPSLLGGGVGVNAGV